MQIIVSPHAALRFKERGIHPSMVKRVISQSSNRKTKFDDRIEVTGVINDGKKLTVIYKIVKKKFLIITSYYEN
jgi:uncharacterized DUF497 family protein